MRARLIALHERRALLREAAADERQALLEALSQADYGQQLLGRASGILAMVGPHRIWIGAAALALFAIFPGRAVRWLAVGMSAWQLASRVIRTYRTFAPIIEQAAEAIRARKAERAQQKPQPNGQP